MKKSTLLLPVLAMLGFCLSCGAVGGVIYKYLDAEGKVSYTDQLPDESHRDGALLVETIEVASPAPVEGATEASNALIEQLEQAADRLKEDRQDRDSARLAEEKLRLARQQQSLPPVVYRQERYSPKYYSPRRYYPGRHYSESYSSRRYGFRRHQQRYYPGYRNQHRRVYRENRRQFPDYHRLHRPARESNSGQRPQRTLTPKSRQLTP